MDPLAGMDDSSTDDETASQTTEDDPQVPENHPPQPPEPTPAPLPVHPPPQPAPSTSQREKPHYALRHTLRGHMQSISAVKFSPDGKLLASCGAEKVVKIWSPETGEFLRNLTGHTQGLSDIAWSSDSVYLASASDDTNIRIWDVETGLTHKLLKGHTKWVFCLNYNTASNLLVSGGCDGDVRIWNAARGKCMKTLHAHMDYVTAVHFNRDATLIVSCALDGLIRIWNTSDGQCLKTLAEGHDAICQHVQFSPNSKYILSTAHDSVKGRSAATTTLKWRMSTLRTRREITVKGTRAQDEKWRPQCGCIICEKGKETRNMTLIVEVDLSPEEPASVFTKHCIVEIVPFRFCVGQDGSMRRENWRW